MPSAPSISALDLLVIAGTLVPALLLGVRNAKEASGGGEAYFLGGRTLPGWLLGVSVVATTFAADTPLVVSAMVARQGIAANWFWWAVLVAHVGVVLFWAPLWRRAAVLTDAEFCELRYGPGVGRTLRTVKAIFLALPYNLIVLGWVLRGMQKILEPFVAWSQWLPEPLWLQLVQWFGAEAASATTTVIVLTALTAFYSTLGGLRSVIQNDLFQFVLAMLGSVALAVFSLKKVGGWDGLHTALLSSFGEERTAALLSPLPTPGLVPSESVPSVFPMAALMVCLFLRWWATPMADGGGYLAQRFMAARDEGQAKVAAGIFVVLHYVVRPWPWILCGLAGLVIFPPGNEAETIAAGAAVAADRELVYPLLVAALLPDGLRGLVIGSLFAAFMSTVDTHLNWGSSYVAHDLWANRVRPRVLGPGAPEAKEIVLVGRLASVVFAALAVVVALQIESVEGAWKFVGAMGAGLGLPVLLRWLWWRVNAQAELLGAAVAFVGSIILYVVFPAWPWERQLVAAVSLSTVAVLGAVLWFPPAPEDVLRTFVERVLPPGRWGPFRAPGGREGSTTLALLRWIVGAMALALATMAPAWGLGGSPVLAVVALVVGLSAFVWAAGFVSTAAPRRHE